MNVLYVHYKTQFQKEKVRNAWIFSFINFQKNELIFYLPLKVFKVFCDFALTFV